MPAGRDLEDRHETGRETFQRHASPLREDEHARLEVMKSPEGRETGKLLTVNLEHYPNLGEEGGTAQISVEELERPLIVTQSKRQVFHALDSQCTHQGCEVEATMPTLDCPCHGSRFKLDGRVEEGPAERPLKSFPVRREDDVLVIELPTDY